MAYNSNKTPAELSELSALATNDTIIVGDTSDTSEVVKKITAENLYVDIAAASMTMTNKIITTPTITLKQSASPAPTAEGDIQWDTDNDKLVIGDGATAKTFVPTSAVSGDATMDTSGVLTSSWASAKTIIPQPAFGVIEGATPTTLSITTNTTAYVGQVIIPFKMTVNKVSIRTGTATTPEALDISLYSEDGQTRYFSVTTATVSATAVITTAVSAVDLTPGVYYLMVNGNGTISVQTYVYTDSAVPITTTAGLLGDVSSEPVLRGTLTITAGTPPATIDPTAITDAAGTTLICRLDN